MCKFLCLFICLCTSLFSEAFRPPKNYRHYLSVCAVFRDEAPFLKEWIEYHLLVGVDHFYLFNNESVDEYLEVLQPYIKKGVVNLFNWPSRVKNGEWQTDQDRAYSYCLRYCKNSTFWLAVIDLDEFIVPVENTTVREFLSQFDQNPSIGTIRVNWQLYGTSNLSCIPSDSLLIESLTLKAPWDYHAKLHSNTHVKSISRPQAMTKCSIHVAELKKGYQCLPSNLYKDPFTKKDQSRQTVQIDKIRINHYWTRAEDFFYAVKMPRLRRWLKPQVADGNVDKACLEIADELNQVEDRIMDRFVPQLRERMGLDSTN